MRAFIALIILLFGNFIIMFDTAVAAYVSPLETYIVHVEPPANARNELSELEKYYLSFMPTASRSGEEVARILFSYENVFFGFSAKLSDEDVKEMETKPGFISAEKEDILHMDTTYSPNFIGLFRSSGLWPLSNYGRGVIIGVLDTGINPDHPSFSDADVPVPSVLWRGRCEFSPPSCNNKIIGARSFVGGLPFDTNGHGSHVAGTAAGNFVTGANFNGIADGTAAGIAPFAHLSVYKVCDNNQCPESAVLAGMDCAIRDGVDIISMSLGGGSKPFYLSNSAIGAYAATEKGIFVSCSAGNSGPSRETLSNEAPWVLTVGASNTNRQIRAMVLLGNNRRFIGQSTFQINFPTRPVFPLKYPGLTSSDPNIANCARSQFPSPIIGMIVICFNRGSASATQKGINVRDAGGLAMILINEEKAGYTTRAEVHVLPTSQISYADGLEIIAYMRSTTSPTATLELQGTWPNADGNAPAVADFSSRGPNSESYGILKPDILGPGVDILAASHNSQGFSMMSGTSVACSHLSGVAALLKSTRPNWSPAAIKSAIMTTSRLTNSAAWPIADHFRQPATPLEMGSGQVNPTRANNPGLIYNLTAEDYIPYLCGLRYTPQQLRIILRRDVQCTNTIAQTSLNYPSLSVIFGSSPQNYSRTVTNVGIATSTYNSSVQQPPGLFITVNPTVLSFISLNQRLSYQVTFRLTNNMSFTNTSVHRGFFITQGSITWTSGTFSVRIPVIGLIRQNDIFSTSAPLLKSYEELLSSV